MKMKASAPASVPHDSKQELLHKYQDIFVNKLYLHDRTISRPLQSLTIDHTLTGSTLQFYFILHPIYIHLCGDGAFIVSCI